MALGLAGTANADEKKKSVYEQVVGDIKGGKLNVEGDHAAVVNLVIKRNIPITYEYISQLLRTPNAFGAGPACIICHHSNDPAISYRGLDLSSCEGIQKGATEAPARPIVVAGEPGKSLIRRMIRNNRMPLGVSFAAPTDTPAITAVKDWINAGAKDDAAGKKVVESFKKPGAFGTEQACVDCHMSNEEPPSFHELDLTSVKGILKGADSVANAKEGKPATPVAKPGDAAGSPLYQRLIENRMSPGIDPGEDRDHANTQLLLQWIKQGAKCQ
ncbi:MAG: hypothetical protein EPN26_05325 [Rhodospirillales bacterium]|nr:MAG: hypothetical protein EPN26_05325 [Rhodospirillales bacterium]